MRFCLWTAAVLWCAWGAADAQYADLSAQRVAEIAVMLPDKPHALAPACRDRATWDPMAHALRPQVEHADALLGKTFPAWSDEAYMDYYTSGSRERGQAMLNARQSWLVPLLLAECAEWKGRFLPALNKTLTELATQPSWSLPAHDVDKGYITGKRYFVELNSSALGYTMATSLALMGDRLSEQTRTAVMQALERRMFAPMRASYASGKGQTWLRVESNWNAVCFAGVTGAALAVLEDKRDRALFVAAAEHYQQFYKNSFPADGFEVEGIGYWNYGFSNYAVLREELAEATGGKIDLFSDPKMQRVAGFGRDIQMLPGNIAYFSDAHFGEQPSRALLDYISHVFRESPAEKGSVKGEDLSGTLAFDLITLFPSDLPAPAVSSDSNNQQQRSALRTYYPVAGVLVARPGRPDGLAFTIKAGGDGPHNHNDIGSYAVGLGRSQPVGEPGGPAFYTSQTFSKNRFVSKLLSSYGHPVPVVDGHLQRNSLQVKAPVTAAHFTDGADSMTIDMTDAYDTPSLKQLLRSIEYSRSGRGSVEMTDAYNVVGAVPVEEAITTRGQWRQVNATTFEFTQGGESLRVRVQAPGAITVSAEKINEYGSPFTRVALHTTVHAGDKVVLRFEASAQ